MSRFRYPRFTAAALIGAGLAYYSTSAAQTPEQQKIWETERAAAQADEQAKAERLAKQRDTRRRDPMAWVHTLDPMTSGGWTFRAVGADGSWAAFSTDHQLQRSGHLITAWLRQEFPEAQRSDAGDGYRSDVQRIQYDCAKQRSRVLLIIYYAGNNLTGSQQNEAGDLKQADWDPVIPGTQSEYSFQWFCGTGSAGPRPR